VDSHHLASALRACRSMLERRVRFDVFDRDRGKEVGEPLGWAHYNLDLVAEGQVSEQWVQLRNVFAGELRIRVLVLSGTDDNVEVCLPSHMSCLFLSVAQHHGPKNWRRRAGACEFT
jgi:hypothetical protein